MFSFKKLKERSPEIEGSEELTLHELITLIEYCDSMGVKASKVWRPYFRNLSLKLTKLRNQLQVKQNTKHYK